MNIEFLKSLEKVKSDDFDRSHKTQSELDDKARNLSAAFTVFFTATIGYSLDSFPTASMLQQIFLLSLAPAYLASIWLFKEALASREYIEGMTIKLPLADISEEEYLKKRIKFLNTSFNKNCDSNNTKSKALTGGITMFLASFFYRVSVFRFRRLFLPLYRQNHHRLRCHFDHFRSLDYHRRPFFCSILKNHQKITTITNQDPFKVHDPTHHPNFHSA